MKFLKDYDSDHEFTKDELKELIYCHHYKKEPLELVDENFSSDLDRWTRSVTTILKAEDRYFRFTWEQGLTECQENYFPFNPVEVVKKEETRLVTVTSWREKNENNW